MAQNSALMVPLGPLTISGIGQADDSALLANNIHNLNVLIHLKSVFCSKYQVQLSSEKTKLVVYHKKELQFATDYWKFVNPIKVNGTPIKFVEAAEHVGLIRSVAGNSALGTLLHTGLSRSHKANPTASLIIQQMYSTLYSYLVLAILS